MSAFKMQVACKCTGIPSGMECVEMWDGHSTPHLVAGRRYVWECLNCGHQVCINMAIMGDEE
tara:strand:- start:346 stop:531 length:186 start_codon:yes stop_codon:yes gene_type:complete